MDSFHRDPKWNPLYRTLLSLGQRYILKVLPSSRMSAEDVLSSLINLRTNCTEDTEVFENPDTSILNWNTGVATSHKGLTQGEKSAQDLHLLNAQCPTVNGRNAPSIPPRHADCQPVRTTSDAVTAPATSSSLSAADWEQPPSIGADRLKRRTTLGYGHTEPRKRHARSNSRTEQTPPKRFACPFYKNDPERYKYRRTCCGPGWPQFHRVK